MDKLQFLAQSIAKAKRVVDRVETGSYTTGHVNRENLVDTSAVMEEGEGPVTSMPSLPQPQPQVAQVPNLPAKNPMMASIMESFRQNPGQAIGTVNTSNPLAANPMMDALANQVKQVQGPVQKKAPAQPGLSADQRRMIEERFNPTNQFDAPQGPVHGQNTNGLGALTQQFVAQQPVAQPVVVQPAVAPQMLSEDYVKYLIEKAVDQAVEKTVKAVMEELNKPTSIDENIQIKIGGKTFGGKIKTLKS